MFYNLFRNAMRKETYRTGVRHVLYQNQRMTASHSDANISDDLKIEVSLFENSTQKHKPVASSDDFLRQQKLKTPIPLRNDVQTKYLVKKEKADKIIKDPELGLEFYRESKLLTPVLIAVRSRKQRDKKRKIVIEGRRLIGEAIKCKLRLDTLVFSQRDQLLAIKDEIANCQRVYGSKIFKVSQHELKTWSTLTTPPGLLAIFERPAETQLEKDIINARPLPITVVCDNIREPSNLGSIIRTCAALPCAQLIVTKGCCDPWESKVLRGGCGGHFRLLIRDDVCWTEIEKWIPTDCQDNYRVFIAENNINKARQETAVSVSNYQDIGLIGTHNIIVIGGESHGVSKDAYNLLETSRRGKCLFIPLADGIDSLNVASALTLILYEFRSQLHRIQTQHAETC